VRSGNIASLFHFRIFRAFFRKFRTLLQVRSGNIASLFPEAERAMSREVEDEANSYFQRIYNHPPHPTLSIDEVLELLKKFQTSGGQRETDVFFCMIKAWRGPVCSGSLVLSSGCWGSVTLWYGSGCGSGIPKNIRILRILNTGKKSYINHKQKKLWVFLQFLLDDGRIRSLSRIRTCDQWIRMRIREAQKHTDPDPQHCYL
jgi:hypothetical protein